jgi:hypothetical protein
MRIIIVVAALVASVGLASNANAGLIDDVGLVDTQKAAVTCSTNLPTCAEAELAKLLGLSIDQVTLTQAQSGWVQVTGTNYVAFDFGAVASNQPGYYAVKLGNTAADFYIFQNLASTRYALIDLSLFTPANGRGNISIDSVSHIATVSEPGSFSLLLSGLAVLGLVSVKRFRPSR